MVLADHPRMVQVGKAIVEGLVFVIIAAIIAIVVIYIKRRQSKDTALDRGWAIKGDLSARQERILIAEVNTAAILFRQLLAPPSDLTSDMTYLRQEDRQKIEGWLRQHNSSRGSNMRRAVEQA